MLVVNLNQTSGIVLGLQKSSFSTKLPALTKKKKNFFIPTVLKVVLEWRKEIMKYCPKSDIWVKVKMGDQF